MKGNCFKIFLYFQSILLVIGSGDLFTPSALPICDMFNFHLNIVINFGLSISG